MAALEKRNFHWKIDSCQPQIKAMRSGEIELHALTKGHYPGILLKPSQLPGINSVGFWNSVRPQNWGIDTHRNEGLEISFLETGSMEFSVRSKRYQLHARQFTITRPWEPHKLGLPHVGLGKMHWLILDVGARPPDQNWTWPSWLTLVEADKAQLARNLRNTNCAVWNASPVIASVFSSLSNCVLNWKHTHAESRMIILLNQLFVEILTVLTEQQANEDPGDSSRRYLVQTFLNQLAEHGGTAGQMWTLESMAAECQMSITTFSKYCRELVNNGPMEYFNRCRLERCARQLREDSARPVTEIAFQNGFNSSQYFASVFHRRYGLSPSQYRKNDGCK